MTFTLLVVLAVIAAGTMLRLRCAFAMLAAGAGGLVAELGFQRGTLTLVSLIQEAISSYVWIALAGLALAGEVNRVTGAEGGVRRLVQSIFAGTRAAPTVVPLLSSALQGPLLLRCGLSVDNETRREAIEMLTTMEIQGVPSLQAWEILTAGSCCALLLVPGFVTFIAAASFKTSIGLLLANMILPGVLLLLLYMTMAGVVAAQLRNIAPLPKRQRRQMAVWRDLEGVVAKIGGVLVALAAIFQGITTPTEAAAILVLAMLFAAWLQRERPRPKDLRFALEEAAKSAAGLLLTLVAATVLSVVLTATVLPAYVSATAEAFGTCAPLVLLLILPAALSALVGIPAALVLCGAMVGQYAPQSGLSAPAFVVLISYAVVVGRCAKTMMRPPTGAIDSKIPIRRLLLTCLWSAPPLLVWVAAYLAPGVVTSFAQLMRFD